MIDIRIYNPKNYFIENYANLKQNTSVKNIENELNLLKKNIKNNKIHQIYHEHDYLVSVNSDIIVNNFDNFHPDHKKKQSEIVLKVFKNIKFIDWLPILLFNDLKGKSNAPPPSPQLKNLLAKLEYRFKAKYEYIPNLSIDKLGSFLLEHKKRVFENIKMVFPDEKQQHKIKFHIERKINDVPIKLFLIGVLTLHLILYLLCDIDILTPIKKLFDSIINLGEAILKGEIPVPANDSSLLQLLKSSQFKILLTNFVDLISLINMNNLNSILKEIVFDNYDDVNNIDDFIKKFDNDKNFRNELNPIFSAILSDTISQRSSANYHSKNNIFQTSADENLNSFVNILKNNNAALKNLKNYFINIIVTIIKNINPEIDFKNFSNKINHLFLILLLDSKEMEKQCFLLYSTDEIKKYRKKCGTDLNNCKVDYIKNTNSYEKNLRNNDKCQIELKKLKDNLKEKQTEYDNHNNKLKKTNDEKINKCLKETADMIGKSKKEKLKYNMIIGGLIILIIVFIYLNFIKKK